MNGRDTEILVSELKDRAEEIVGDLRRSIAELKELKRQTEPPPWVPDWPRQEGWFWFYGWRSTYAKYHTSHPTPSTPLQPLELCAVKVKRGGTAFFYVADGGFVYRSEGAEGLWQPMHIPQLPK